MPTTETKLTRLLAAMDDSSLTRDEFVKSFEQVVQFVLKIEQKNTEAIDRLEKTYQMFLEKANGMHTSSIADIKGQVNDVFVGDQINRMRSEHEHMLSVVDEKIAGIKNGVDGRRGMPGPKGEDGAPDTGEEIIVKINDDKSNRVIKKEKVEGLSEIENVAKTARSNSQYALSVVGSGISWGVPTGTVDDSNTSFTVSTKPIFIIVNGGIYREGKGIYTSYSGGTITLSTPVGTGGFIVSAH